MTIRIKLRRDTLANWATANPILALGEQGLETDTGRMKMGDGVTAWNNLDYSAPNLERSRSGWVTTWGPRFENDYTEYWWNGVVADSDGNAYLTGSDESSSYASVAKLNVNGEKQWNKLLNGPDGYEGYGVDVKLAADGQPVILSSVNNSDNTVDRQGYNLHKLNVTTGAIIAGSEYRVKDETDGGSDTGDLYARELAIDGAGDYIVVGSRYGDRRQSNIDTVLTGTGVNAITFQIDPAMPYPQEYNNSYISTQNNSNTWSISGVNRYNGLTPVVTYASTGTGLILDVEIALGMANATIASGGTGYTVGRLVKVSGSESGGIDVTNDLIFEVTSVNSGVVTGIAAPSGTPGSDGNYNGLATSIATPTTPVVDLQFRLSTTGTFVKSYQGGTGGIGHSIGDTLTVSGDTFVGGTTPANDWSVTVTGIDPGGQITSLSSVSWAPPTDYLKLDVDAGGNDFSTGTYKLNIDTSEQLFIHKHGVTNWAKTLGGVDTEYFHGVTLDSSDNIYAVGSHYNRDFPSGGRWESLVVKFNTSGSVQWSKSYDVDGYEGNTAINNAVTDSNDNIYLVQAGNPATLTKIDTNGAIVFQKYIGDGDPISMWNATVDIDSNDNVYFLAEINSAVNPTDDFLLMKFNSAGVLQWQRSLGTIYQEDSSWNNSFSYLAVKGDKIFFVGSTQAYNHSNTEYRNIAFCVQLTTDGVWVGDTGVWKMTESNWNVGNSTNQLVTDVSYTSRNSDVTVYNPTFTQVDQTSGTNTDVFHTGDDYPMRGVSRIEFEDGQVVDKYAGRSIPPLTWDTTYGGTFYLGPREAGRHILLEDDTVGSTFYIPGLDVVDLPIGTVFTIVIINKQNNVYVNYYGSNTPQIYGNGESGSATNWQLASNSKDGTYTIMKVKDNMWIINGPDVTKV